MAMDFIKYHHLVHPSLSHHVHSLVMGNMNGGLAHSRLLISGCIPRVLIHHLLSDLVICHLSHWVRLSCWWAALYCPRLRGKQPPVILLRVFATCLGSLEWNTAALPELLGQTILLNLSNSLCLIKGAFHRVSKSALTSLMFASELIRRRFETSVFKIESWVSAVVQRSILGFLSLLNSLYVALLSR